MEAGCKQQWGTCGGAVVHGVPATTAGTVIRLLRSGALVFWLAVISVMVVIGVWAATVAPATEPEAQPAISEMFDNAVDLRHQLAAAVRSGDTVALATWAGQQRDRWDAAEFVDRDRARAAAAAVLDRLVQEASRPGPLDGTRRDRLTAEADLFAALATGYDSPAVVDAVAEGVEAVPVRPVPDGGEGAVVDARSRARERLERTGVDLDELEARLGAAGGPELDTGSLEPGELVRPTRP